MIVLAVALLVVISGSNLPPHLSYYYGADSDQFEEFDYSRGEEYRPNPNQIELTKFTIRIPINPSESGNAIDARTVNLTVGDGTDYPQGPAGVAVDGATYFNPLAAPGDDIEDERFTFDFNEGPPSRWAPTTTTRWPGVRFGSSRSWAS